MIDLTGIRLPPRRWLALASGWLVFGALAVVLAGETARRDAEAELARQAEASAALHAAVLRSELEKHRSLPVVLAQDPEVASLLLTPSPVDVELVNRKLEALARQTRAAAIYVLDAEGVARAASNWRLPTSFVGSDYSFRPYFTGAVQRGDAELFALGTVSGRPGLYLSRRVIDGAGRVQGVVVVKVEFDALEADWRASGEPAYVSDDRGVVLVTSVTDWRFRTTAPLSPDQRQAILAGQTLGPRALAPLPFTVADAPPRVVTVAVNSPETAWMSARAPTTVTGWTLHLLTPVGGTVRAAVLSAQAVAGLLVTLLAIGLAVLIRRRQLAAAREAAEEQTRAELERRIEERTAELRQAEAGREALRDELVQANKLATLGQIAAGVAHEINQPVGAIRTYADTAATYAERGDPAGARRALTRIGELTARIGAITDELRAFSRKTTAQPTPVSPDAAIDGALLLLGGRLRASRVEIVRTHGPDGVSVIADRFRLEQVIVNLIQNAVEALDEAVGPDPRLEVKITARGKAVQIAIADNGPGITPEVAANLFTPFVTTKPTGLGLGLVICRDIVAGFGGELDLKPGKTGAAFVITLRKA